MLKEHSRNLNTAQTYIITYNKPCFCFCLRNVVVQLGPVADTKAGAPAFTFCAGPDDLVCVTKQITARREVLKGVTRFKFWVSITPNHAVCIFFFNGNGKCYFHFVSQVGYITFFGNFSGEETVAVCEPEVADARADPLAFRLRRDNPVYVQEWSCVDMYDQLMWNGTLTLIAGTWSCKTASKGTPLRFCCWWDTLKFFFCSRLDAVSYVLLVEDTRLGTLAFTPRRAPREDPVYITK